MKIIICGSGFVAYGIAKQLANEDNEIILIDDNLENLQKISAELDIGIKYGFPSHPKVLKEADGANAKMIIAVTASDEVNMIICEMAYCLFDTKIKIARIHNKAYLIPEWQFVFSKNKIPVDYIISPEKEVADAIVNRLQISGATNATSFFEDKAKVIEVKCTIDFPFISKTIKEIHYQMLRPQFTIFAIYRNQKLIFCDNSTIVNVDDDLFVITETENINKVMNLFGHSPADKRNLILIGGGNIGFNVAEKLENLGTNVSLKIIEFDKKRAIELTEAVNYATIINGSGLDSQILEEANVKEANALIAVTNDDEVNLLSSVLAKKMGAETCFALINNMTAYEKIVPSLSIDVAINPKDMTVSKILQHTRKGKIIAAYSICGGIAEIIELQITSVSVFVDRIISDLDLPSGIKICLIKRDDIIIFPDATTQLLENDKVIVLVQISLLKKLDDMLEDKDVF